MTKKILMFPLIIIVAFAVFSISKSVVAEVILPKHGLCIKATLTKQTIRVKSSKAMLLYSFHLGGELYEGNSLETDRTKIGDSICVLYFRQYPGINRPEAFFANKLPTCKCQ